MILGSIGPKEGIKDIIKSDKAELKDTFKKNPNIALGCDEKKKTVKNKECY